MGQNDETNSSELIFKRIREEILPLFQQAIHDDDVYFQNPNIPPCWERKNCVKKHCPVFDKTGIRCWQSVGTFCGGEVQGTFVDKYKTCFKCSVFTEACPTLVEEVGESLNNLLFLLRKEKKASEQAKKIDYLNKELQSALGNLDSRNREIQELVITDKLTGLYNRNYLKNALDDELHRCERGEYLFSLMMIDLDDFKSINDTYGHMQGDTMLSFLGNVLKKDVRKCDRSFRYGGEEFIVILPETDLTIAWVAAERLRKKFEEKEFTIDVEEGATETVSRTLSVGIACYEKGVTPDELIKRADDAMYKAKQEGKNKTVRYDQIPS